MGGVADAALELVAEYLLARGWLLLQGAYQLRSILDVVHDDTTWLAQKDWLQSAFPLAEVDIHYGFGQG